MKIGIYIRNIPSRGGGGSIFESDVYRAFLETSSKSTHSFVVLSHGKIPLHGKGLPKNVEAINLRHIKRKKYIKFIILRLAGFYNSMIKTIPRVPRLKSGLLTWTEFIAQDIGLDVIWNITPFQGLYPTNVPFITIVWDLQHRLQPWFPEVTSKGEWHGREKHFHILRRATYIITGNQTGRSQVTTLYGVPNERVKLIPLPTPRFALDAKKFGSINKSKRVLKKYNIPAGFLFYPAQFWAHKNHINLLSAVRLLRDNYSISLPVVFTGSDHGNKKYVQRSAIQMGLESQVFFLGFVPQADLVDLYRQALALTFVTFFGPDNLPPLEAFALGCPVIASNIPGAKEQLEDAALFVEPDNTKEIADAIKLIFEDTCLREKLIARGEAIALKCTPNDFVKSVLSLIDGFESIRRCWDR